MNFLKTFAETAEPKGDILSALGIDWRLLIVQIVAFLLLVWLLGKFVYPWLMKSVDERQRNIEKAAKAAKQAQEMASESQAETAELLAEARKEAAKIVETAKLEASEMLSTSETRARTTAESIVSNAQAHIQKDIDKARRDLHNETLELVSMVTEKVVRGTHDKKADEKMIADVLKETR